MKVDEVLRHICIVDDSYTQNEIDKVISQARQQLKELVLGCLTKERKLEKDSQYLQYDKGYNHAIGDVKDDIEELFK